MYRKGATFERWLLHALERAGFLVARTAGSGHSKAPDLLAFKGAKAYAFEAKFHEGPRLSLRKEQMALLLQWEKKAFFQSYVVWKRSRKPPLFLPPAAFRETEKAFTITWEEALMHGKSLLEL